LARGPHVVQNQILFFQEGWYLARGPNLHRGEDYFSKKDGTWQEDHILLRGDTIFPRRMVLGKGTNLLPKKRWHLFLWEIAILQEKILFIVRRQYYLRGRIFFMKKTSFVKAKSIRE
jgi:hypothetical protein